MLRNLGYNVSALGALLTFCLLFQPWVVVRGGNGSIEADAFGRLDMTTNYLTVFAQHRPPSPSISGIGGLLASMSILVTCLSVLIYTRMRTELIARAITITAAITAVQVLSTLLYLNSQRPAMLASVSRQYDLGGMIGNVLAWAGGKSILPIPGVNDPVAFSSAVLTPSGLLACASALVSAIAAAVQWLADHPNFRIKLPPGPLTLARTGWRTSGPQN